MAVEEIVELYGAAWHESHEPARRPLLERAWADDGVLDGMDVGTLAADGRLARIVGFFGPLQPA